MNISKTLSNILDLLIKIDRLFYINQFLPGLGLIPLAYVFYVSFIDLPPFLNDPIVFIALFTGLALVLHWRLKFFTPSLFVGYVGLFFLPITWLWRGLEFDDNVLMGIFPFNDGMFYIVDAYRLNAGLGTMILQNGRPLYPGLLALFMWIFDENIPFALALFCVFTVFVPFKTPSNI